MFYFHIGNQCRKSVAEQPIGSDADAQNDTASILVQDLKSCSGLDEGEF
jgi:hypothetical protein